MTMYAGRKASSTTAHCFRNMEGWPMEPSYPGDYGYNPLSGSNMYGISNDKNTVPNDLNFALKGTMHIDVLVPSPVSIVCDDIRIAQGNKGTRNNWWVGCSGGSTTDGCGMHQLNCPCKIAGHGGEPTRAVMLSLRDGKNGVNTFQVTWCYAGS